MVDREREAQERKEEEQQEQEGGGNEQPQEQPRSAMELFGEVTAESPDTWQPQGPEAQTRGEEITREITPVARTSNRERVEQRQEMEEDAPGLLEGWNMARDSEWVHRLALQNRPYAPDPDYTQDPDRLLELSKDAQNQEAAIDYIGEAESREEEEFRAKRYMEDEETEQGLAKMGLTGTALRVGAAITDPGPWGAGTAASALTGPFGLVGTAANRLTRAQRIIRSGAVGATGSAAVETAIAHNKPIYDEMNILYAAGLGFGISGGLSALSRNPSLTQEAKTLREEGLKMQQNAEQETIRVTEDALNFNVKNGKPFTSLQGVKNSKRFRETPGAEPIQIREGEWAWRVRPDEAAGGSSGDTGAARVSRKEPLSPEHVDIDQFIKDAERFEYIAPETAYGNVGGLVSSVSRLKSSKNPASRAIGGRYGEDATGNKNRDIPTDIPATQRQLKEQRKNEMRWGQGWKVNLRKFREEVGDSPTWKIWQKPEQERQFARMISDYVEGVTEDVPAPVKAQGDLLRDIFDDYRVNLNQPGAYRGEFMRPPDGFGTKERDPYYLPHEFDYESFNRLVTQYGDANVEDLFTRAIRNASDDITEEAARRAAKAYVKTVRKLRVGLGDDAGRILGSGDAEEIKKFLKDQSEMADNEVDDVVDALTARKTSKGSGSKHGKARTPLDMSTELHDVRFNPETMGQGRGTMRIRDFFNRDAHDLFTKYNRRMSGELAMARTRIPGLADGIVNNAEWETLKTRMREIGERVGQTRKEIEDDIAQADYLYKAVKGIPDEGSMGSFAQNLRRVRDWNFMRVMGQVVFAQFPEVATAVTGIGLKAAFKSVPGFRAMWRNAETGKLDDELVDELEMAIGFGGDYLRLQHVNRFDNPANTMDTSMGSRFEQGYENFTKEGKRAVFAGSGMAAINAFTQRLSMAGIANRFDEMSRGGKSLSPQRLRAMGLSDAKVDKILDNMARHAEHKQGLTGRKLRRLNLSDWDLDAAADFEEAMFTYSRRLVQENDPGQFRPIMSKPLAQTILQFRTFIMGAHTKALLHNIHMRDFQAFSMFLTSSMMGAMGYMAYTVANSQGRSDKDAYLKERLSWDNVAKAAFERSSWAALMPTAIDTAAMPFTDPIFDFRTTGQSTDIIFGNPSSDLIDSASSSVGSVFNPLIEGRAPSQEEIQAGMRSLPFQNLHGVTQMTNLLLGESGLPERAPRD